MSSEQVKFRAAAGNAINGLAYLRMARDKFRAIGEHATADKITEAITLAEACVAKAREGL